MKLQYIPGNSARPEIRHAKETLQEAVKQAVLFKLDSIWVFEVLFYLPGLTLITEHGIHYGDGIATQNFMEDPTIYSIEEALEIVALQRQLGHTFNIKH